MAGNDVRKHSKIFILVHMFHSNITYYSIARNT